MGLDFVEFVMSVEEKFNITISDQEAEKIETVGQFHRLVIDKLGVTETLPASLPPQSASLPVETLLSAIPAWPPPERPIWDAICQLLKQQLEIPLHLITPQARFIDDLDMG